MDKENYIIAHSKKIRKRMDEAWEAYKRGDFLIFSRWKNKKRGKRGL